MITSRLYSIFQDHFNLPIVVFGPVIEHHNTTGERFLLDDPVQLIKKKLFTHVPVVTGIVKDEFKEWFGWMFTNSEENQHELKILNDNIHEILPSLLLYNDRTDEEKRKITEEFKRFYLNGGTINNSTKDGLGNAFADAIIIHGEHTTAKLLAKYNNAPVYFYMLNYLGRFGHVKDATTGKVMGPTHHDDLIYLFYISKIFPKFNTSDPEAIMVRRLTTLWSNFASSGNPTPTSSPVQWLPIKDNNLKYLDINKDLNMVDGLPYPERMKVWDSLLPVD
ncbi:hypothetical protein LSTR_LSTR000587 [Laodelphax striatellus]|uniref:Carboxylesterase type B domain-containing protein n=1 Tax=Laodelphax striatellus TaxID=195883 RepID=A0A482XF20_LAOST|nr:hypothetical protein LSTR_LSTR000587 [Laodelphax striatellus]